MLVRPATAADVPALRRIEAASTTAAHWSEDAYQQLFTVESPRLALVIEDAEDAGALRGFLIARQTGPEWEIENIVVAENRQRRGLASVLLRHLLATARRQGGESVFLEVRESNAPARTLYGKHGFVESGRRRSYYENPTEDAILYRLSLRPATGT